MIIDFVGKRLWYIIFSAIIVVPGLISLAIPPGLKPGIEFTSGSLMTLRFDREVDQGELRTVLSDAGQGDAIIQRTTEGDYLVRTRVLKQETRDENGNIVTAGERDTLMAKLRDRF